ncbi:phosphoserine phosphatase RsbU-like protein [Knoellia remsis]|uniref:Phosphoserine phosphatase RsbU-like protein n=1 Tax=Knoellia remsis TaxID=407159 RepID=A0A2T0UXI9_9MICO|nr:phosphatase RsbU N-terminal domain-containing protein [Knoellia remsis]PRY62643.1 phosphoserine phosphatase RsbU-like protein [Knoellia remsis]
MTVDAVDRVRQSYRVAFLRYLPRREEAALLTGYDIGRAALKERVSVVALSAIHHEVLTEALLEDGADAAHTITSAEQFLAEVLAPFDLASGVVGDLAPKPGAAGR